MNFHSEALTPSVLEVPNELAAILVNHSAITMWHIVMKLSYIFSLREAGCLADDGIVGNVVVLKQQNSFPLPLSVDYFAIVNRSGHSELQPLNTSIAK